MMVMLSICLSCGVENLGESECATELKKALAEDDDEYYDDIYFDESGIAKEQSYENCVYARDKTLDYLQSLGYSQELLATSTCMSDTEILEISADIEAKERDLEQDLENVWSGCESRYNE